MGGNGNELSGAIRELECFFKCVNVGNGNGKDLAGMGGIGNTENHSRTSLPGRDRWRVVANEVCEEVDSMQRRRRRCAA